MSLPAHEPGEAVNTVPEATKMVSAFQEAPNALDETRYGSLPQDYGHPYLETVSEGYATPTPPYSAWPIAQQEAIRLANQQHLPKAMFRPVISTAAPSGDVTSSDESALQLTSDRLVRAARRNRVLGKAGRNKQLANSSQPNASTVQEILAHIARLETTLSNKIDTAQSLTPRYTCEGETHPTSKDNAKDYPMQTSDVIQKTSGQWNLLPVSPKLADAIVPVMLIALGVLYPRNDSRLLFNRLVHEHAVEPLTVTIYALILLYVGKLAVTIPGQVSLLSGDCLQFEDAFGISIKVPSSTYSHIKIFRAFVEVHFEGKPGLEMVLKGKYVLWKRRGSSMDEIQQNEWNSAVSRGSRLVMSMLVGAFGLICVGCWIPLRKIRYQGILECIECNRKYRRAHGDGRSLPLDVVSEPGLGSAISSTVISSLEIMTDGDVIAGVKDNKNFVEERECTKLNTRSELRYRLDPRFKHRATISTGLTLQAFSNFKTKRD